MKPLPGESVSEWVQANGWTDPEDADLHLRAEGNKVWGAAPNQMPLQEEVVRALHGDGMWKPHVLST